jgi:hypothetical protein
VSLYADNMSLRTKIVKAKARRVRTPGGQKKYGQPIGTVITADMVRRAAAVAAAGTAGARGGGGRKTPVVASGGGTAAPDSEYAKRLAYYHRGVQRAQDGPALERLVARLEADSILDDEDYDGVLDRIEAKAAKIGALTDVPDAAPDPRAPKPAKKAAAPKKPKADPIEAHIAAIDGAKDVAALRLAVAAVARDGKIGPIERNALAARANKRIPELRGPKQKPQTSPRVRAVVQIDRKPKAEPSLKDVAREDVALKREIAAARAANDLDALKALDERIDNLPAPVKNNRKRNQQAAIASVQRRKPARGTATQRNMDDMGLRSRTAHELADLSREEKARLKAKADILERRIDAAKNLSELEQVWSALKREAPALNPDDAARLRGKARAKAPTLQRRKQSGLRRLAQAVMGRRSSATWANADTGVGPQKLPTQQAPPRPRQKAPAPAAANVPANNNLKFDLTGLKRGKRPGSGAQLVVVDIADNFRDDEAMKAALGNLIEPGAGVVLVGRRAARMTMLIDDWNAGKPEADQIKIVHNRQGEIDAAKGQQILSVWEDANNEIKGKGFVVAFRKSGETVGVENDLVNVHLRRGVDTFGNQREALIVQDGYRAKRNKAGEDVDSHAFGLANEDLPPPKASINDKMMAAHHMQAKHGRDPNIKMARGGKGVIPMAAPAGKDYNLTDTPAGKHIAKGGDVMTAPNEGLAAFIINNPQRFVPEKRLGGGISTSMAYVDQTNGKRYFVKKAEEGGGGRMYGDAANEVLLGDIMLDFMPGRSAKVRYGADPNLKETWIVAEHVGDVVVDSPSRLRPAQVERGQIAEPKEWYKLLLFDFVVNQTDRHHGNWLEEKTPKGRRMVVIDNGGADGAHIGYESGPTFDRWWHGRWPAQMLGPEIGRAYLEAGLKKDFDAILAEMKALDIESYVARLKAANKLQGREAAYMDGMAEAWRVRLAQLEKDRTQVIALLLRAKGRAR